MNIVSFGLVIYCLIFSLCRLETTRHVSMITITLSKKELDMSAVGYDDVFINCISVLRKKNSNAFLFHHFGGLVDC